ncbi:unnamed protein product [Calypogeia fissa]
MLQAHKGVAVSGLLAGICLGRRFGVIGVQNSCPNVVQLSSAASSTPIHLHCLFRKMDFWNGTRSNSSNKSLLGMLKITGSLKSERVEKVMKQLDRGIFVPKGEDPYADHPVPIGYNATISAPHMHAECLKLLEEHLQPGMHALDVGSGTGYLTAAFALMVGKEGRAVGVEHIPELVQQSLVDIQRSKAAEFLASGSLSVHVGDGREGWPELAPYHAIHVGAAAESIPQALIDQLKAGGRMVIPVGDIFQDLKVVDKKLDGTIDEWTVTAVRYVPLTNRAAQLRG